MGIVGWIVLGLLPRVPRDWSLREQTPVCAETGFRATGVCASRFQSVQRRGSARLESARADSSLCRDRVPRDWSLREQIPVCAETPLIAKALMPGAESVGSIVTTLLGIAGALLGGFLATALGFGNPIDEFFDLSTWLAAVIGAVIILAVYNAIRGRRLT